MVGLDQLLVDTMDFEKSVNRIKTDVLTDFILAPHYSVVYTYSSGELIECTKNLLRSGQYMPGLPIKIDIPKASGLTRPGAILKPIDRIVYQALVDAISVHAEAQLDRSCVFSHVLLTDDPEFKMFKLSNECWQDLREALNAKGREENLEYAVRTDVSCCFERIYQHNLINLLRSSGCDSRVVNLLERLLLAFTENDSHGILQGMFPSDFLGNFYLASIDDGLKVEDVPFIRYVDDIYMFYHSELEAKKGLVRLCRMLRDEGLNLNESKTDIIPTSELIAEETEIDRLFHAARQEISDTELELPVETPYGFETIWASYGDILPAEEIELRAVKELYEMVSRTTSEAAKIERFCLPYLLRAGDRIAVERSLNGIVLRPHLSRMYCNYLLPFAQTDTEISRRLESIILSEELPYDWSLIWPIAALIDADSVSVDTTNQAIRIIEDSRRTVGLRGVATHLVGKHGNAGQRRLLRHIYDREPSEYVRAAILFSAKYFPINERNSCLRAWGTHSTTNSLIANAMRTGAE